MTESSTHHVVHIGYGFEAGIHLEEDVVRWLSSEDPEVRRRTRDYVCVVFREACTEKYGAERTRDITWVEWDEIHITQPSQPVVRACCDNDDCQMCDLGYHERCRNGCTL